MGSFFCLCFLRFFFHTTGLGTLMVESLNGILGRMEGLYRQEAAASHTRLDSKLLSRLTMLLTYSFDFDERKYSSSSMTCMTHGVSSLLSDILRLCSKCGGKLCFCNIWEVISSRSASGLSRSGNMLGFGSMVT